MKPQISGIITELYKEAGDMVQQGEVISAAGTCASESELGAHLHLEFYIDQNATDYCTLLK